MPRKTTIEEKFDHWVIREGFSSKFLETYKKIFCCMFYDVSRYQFFFKIFKDFEENSVDRNHYARTRRLILHNKKSNITLYSYLLRYGKNPAIKKFNSYRSKQSLTNTFEYKKEKYNWDERQFKEYNKGRAVTLENLVKKYGEKAGTDKFNKYCQKQSYTNSVDYFVEKYGEKEGRLKYKEVCDNKAHTFENYKRLYGNDAEQKLRKYWENLLKIRSSGVSKISQELFESLDLLNPEKTYYANKNKEFDVFCNNEYQNLYFYDFVDTANKKCIEYNGDYWHKNPKTYCKDKYNEIRKRDNTKIKFLEDLGYDVLVVWDSEYRENKDKIREKCNEFLRS